ncbi:hypothetical protein G6F50_017118 [Rhizopus delemar]|uniref:Uncharacterized protein n=1 Tax=Rhizopus delemar TaxID=936053 RepID=A0A9P6XRH9_9FUNG|nr:hypothetical protein G6F50_017118 [Rhizopus delemar]
MVSCELTRALMRRITPASFAAWQQLRVIQRLPVGQQVLARHHRRQLAMAAGEHLQAVMAEIRTGGHIGVAVQHGAERRLGRVFFQ